MRHNLLKRAAVGGDEDFMSHYHLAAPIEYQFEVDQHALIITANLTYKSIVAASTASGFEPQIRHIIPLRAARSVVTGFSNQRLTRVVITDYGIAHSRVYHTMNCFGLRYAKRQYDYRVDSALVGGEIDLDGYNYQLCYFCRQQRGVGEVKNEISME